MGRTKRFNFSSSKHELHSIYLYERNWPSFQVQKLVEMLIQPFPMSLLPPLSLNGRPLKLRPDITKCFLNARTHKQANNLYKQSCSRIPSLCGWRFSFFSTSFGFSPSLPSGIPYQKPRCWDDRNQEAAWWVCSTFAFGICWATSWDIKGYPRRVRGHPKRCWVDGCQGTCKLKQTKIFEGILKLILE